MIRLDLPLIGSAVSTLETVRALARRHDRLAVLVHGEPGVGKSHLLELLAGELTEGADVAVERVNGQSLSVDLVRQWRERGQYGNLFARWTVKRIDELDLASSSARAELLSLLDYQSKGGAILATTNEYAKLRAESRGRLETRFKVFGVSGPTAEEAAAYLVRTFRIPKAAARQIAAGAAQEGNLALSVNMRAAVEDAESFLAARERRAE